MKTIYNLLKWLSPSYRAKACEIHRMIQHLRDIQALFIQLGKDARSFQEREAHRHYVMEDPYLDITVYLSLGERDRRLDSQRGVGVTLQDALGNHLRMLNIRDTLRGEISSVLAVMWFTDPAKDPYTEWRKQALRDGPKNVHTQGSVAEMNLQRQQAYDTVMRDMMHEFVLTHASESTTDQTNE